jgi:hypothetical protein
MLSLGVCIIVPFHRVGERGVDHDGGTWYSILFRCPGAEVGHLTAFRAEGAPGVVFPGAGLVTEGADHNRHYTMLRLKIGQEPTRADVICRDGLQQSVKTAHPLRDTESVKEASTGRKEKEAPEYSASKGKLSACYRGG